MRVFRFQTWNLDVDGDFEKQIEQRGVLDPNVLPYYPYRDDGLSVFNAIKKYTTRTVNYFYGM
jgi:Lipoxygenase